MTTTGKVLRAAVGLALVLFCGLGAGCPAGDPPSDQPTASPAAEPTTTAAADPGSPVAAAPESIAAHLTGTQPAAQPGSTPAAAPAAAQPGVTIAAAPPAPAAGAQPSPASTPPGTAQPWKSLTAADARRIMAEYYSGASLPVHDPRGNGKKLGLAWRLPLNLTDLPGGAIVDHGGCYCPTMQGRSDGNIPGRYRGIHRGHDLGVKSSQLRRDGLVIPVYAIADGIYDGQRVYAVQSHQQKECKPVIVYHPAADGSTEIYTSVYCHVDTLPEAQLKPGTPVKAGQQIGTIEDPEGAWSAHVHLELYTHMVYASKDSTKRERCGCKSDADCDARTRRDQTIPRGCGIFEDDRYILEPVLFINAK